MENSIHFPEFSLLHAGHVTLDKKWDYDNVISPFSRLYFIVSGSGKVYHHGEELLLQPGYMYLIPSFTYGRYKCDGFLEQYYIHFMENTDKELSVFAMKSFSFQEKAGSWEHSLFQKLIELHPDRNLLKYHPKTYDNPLTIQQHIHQNSSLNAGVLLQTQGILQTLLAYFIREKKTDPNRDTGKKPGRIRAVLLYIQQNLDQKLSISQLASLIHLNADYFSRLFLDHTGSRPLDYILAKRIERAQLLLTTTDNALSEIAFKVGIPNYSHFVRTFKRITTLSPNEYRKKFKK